MSVARKAKKVSLKSRDPLSNVKSKYPTETIQICSISHHIFFDKKPKKKDVGKLSLKFTRSISQWYSHGEADYHISVCLKKGRNSLTIGDFDVAIIRGTACITSSGIDDEYHNMGIGKKVYESIAAYFRVLESDPSGATSVEATRVWKAMKAKTLKIRNQRPRYQVITNRRLKR